MPEIDSSDAARALSGRRGREPKTCDNCGTVFQGLRQARYCSHACAVAGYRESNREELNAKRREKYRRQKDQNPEGRAG